MRATPFDAVPAHTMERRALTHALNTLVFDVRRLASRAEEQSSDAVRALTSRDTALARRVTAWDGANHELRLKIEREGLAAIATHQPTARDLRAILAGLHMAQELERMAEHAAGIARLVLRLEVAEAPDVPPAIRAMHSQVYAMQRQAMRAYVDHDAGLAQQTAALDDAVDALYVQTMRVLLTYMMQDKALISGATYLVWVAYHLERIGDRVTNVCEKVVFAESGDVIDLQERPDPPPPPGTTASTTPI